MEGSQPISSPGSLLHCEENKASLYNEDEENVVGGYDDEYIELLLHREITSWGLQKQQFLHDSLIESARLEGILYILRTRELLGFGFQTAYLSVTYLDRFISKRSIEVEKSWVVRLVSMACLSLAAKMEEYRVPPLSEFCVEDYYFESSMIQRMEFLVLNTLGWKMGSITPFAFIRFFANKFCDDSVPTNEASPTVGIILHATKDVKIMCHRPSVIAAAATLFVLDQGLTRDALEIKISPLNSDHSQIENIICCYNQFQEMDIERFKLSKEIIKTPDLSPISRIQNNGSSSAASSKRKLVFDQSDEYGDFPDKKGKP